MGEPVVIREWNIAGLPVDNFSTENGIIVTKCKRWPLMIDPQGFFFIIILLTKKIIYIKFNNAIYLDQANKWIKTIEKERNLKVIKLHDKDYIRVLEESIQAGTPVILENVMETLDPTLEPLLEMNLVKVGGIDCLNFGESQLEYNHDFRLYITTRLRNPHYLPEIAVKVRLYIVNYE